ncbi:MAG: hypothetical protein R3F34_14490 [Planctomycetota bacterium]
MRRRAGACALATALLVVAACDGARSDGGADSSASGTSESAPTHEETQEPADVAQEDPSRPPPPAPVAGLRGLRVVTSVVSDGLPTVTRTHSFVFPERWQVVACPDGGDASTCAFTYRFGLRTYRRAAGSLEAHALEGDAARDVFVEDLVMRAALLWPDGVAWEFEGDAAVAHGADRGAPDVDLVARLGADGRPESIDAIEGATLLLRVRPEGRIDEGDHVFPDALVIEHGGRTFVERLERVERRAFFVDRFFEPPGAAEPIPDDVVQPIDELPIRPERRHLLADDERNYAAAVLRARERATTWTGDRDGVDWILEIDSSGRPVAVVVRLPMGAEPDEEFALSAPRRALAVAAPSPGDPSDLARLLAVLRRAGGGAPTGAPYLWGPAGRVQLVLPFPR